MVPATRRSSSHCLKKGCKIRRWIERRHPKKSSGWQKRKYFRSKELRNWVFSAKIPAIEKGTPATYFDLFKASAVPIKRHIKIRAKATPYDPEYRDYFEKRDNSRNLRG